MTDATQPRTGGRRIVVVGASAGGVEALTRLVAALPPDLSVPVLVALHMAPSSPSVLGDILDRAGPLPAAAADNNEPLEPGRVYVARPDCHLLVHDGHVRLSKGPVENGHRPAVDTLFRSAARWYGPGAIGVVLSGVLDDGTAGLSVIKARGGTAMVQDPADAAYGDMPRNAIAGVDVDTVLAVPALAAALAEIVGTPVPSPPDDKGTQPFDRLVTETEVMEMEPDAIGEIVGAPSGYACPDCHGVLFEVEDEVLRFRCRVGHGWTAGSLLAEQQEVLEEALWAALRALEERAALASHVAERMRARGHSGAARRFERQRVEMKARADAVRSAIEHGLGSVDDEHTAIVGDA